MLCICAVFFSFFLSFFELSIWAEHFKCVLQYINTCFGFFVVVKKSVFIWVVCACAHMYGHIYMCVCVWQKKNDCRKKRLSNFFLLWFAYNSCQNRCDVCLCNRVLWIVWLMIDSYGAVPHKMYVRLFACIQKGNRGSFRRWGPKHKRFYLLKHRLMHGEQSM